MLTSLAQDLFVIFFVLLMFLTAERIVGPSRGTIVWIQRRVMPEQRSSWRADPLAVHNVFAGERKPGRCRPESTTVARG